MFDGDFRSRRREVNLSGSNRRTGGAKNKRDLLKNAEAQRKQRHERLRREKAARFLQRVTRGFLSRLHTLRDCAAYVVSSESCGKTMAALSMCLSYGPLLTKFDTTRRELILGFQKNLVQNGSVHKDNSSSNHCGPQPMDIVEDGAKSSWFSQKRMVKHAMQLFDPRFESDISSSSESNQHLYQLLSTYKGSTKMDDRNFLELATCMQKWYNYVQAKDINIDSANTNHANEYKAMLTRWAMEASDQLSNPNSKALLATILLSASASEAVSGGAQIEQWFAILANILQSSGDKFATEASAGQDLLLQATMANLRNEQVQRLLSNLLDLTKSPQLVLLIHNVLRQPQNDKLKLAVSLLARGDSVKYLQQQQERERETDSTSRNKGDWDDDSESEDEESDQKPSSQKKARGWSSQYKRQDILTMAKLDRVYNERIQQLIKEHYRGFDALTIEVATKITQAPWKEWGLHILGGGNKQNSSTTEERDRYVETLGYLLQASSSMRPKIRFTPLSSLAFNETILRGLWNVIRAQRGQDGFVLSIFSDLFSHYLVALSDEDFIKYHCKTGSNKILAKDLVERYGQELYELYWAKPVVSSEIQMGSSRGRLLLSGTKLWNALYERWNRLVNVRFCEERAWLFPQIGFNEGDRAVLSNSEVGQHVDDSDDSDDSDLMDVDDDPNQLSTAEAATDALADSFRDPKMARLLTSVPQALPFDRRLKLFHSLLRADKRNTMQAAQSRRAMMARRGMWSEDDGMMWIDGSVREQIKIQRASLYEDSMEQLNELGSKLKHKVQVTFINKHGAEEPGIDGGGVFKEFLDDLIKDGFAAKSDNDHKGDAPQLFSITPKQQLTMNLDLSEEKNMLVHYQFLGRVLGKAVYESILVEPQFCLPFLNQLLGKVNTLEDLKNYDEEYYNNINKLRHYSEEEIDNLGLSFELTVGGNSPSSTPRTVDLVRSGRSIAVTKKNVFQYSQAVANELLNVLGAKQTRAFLTGFRDLIKVAWIRLFSAKELQKLISGDDSVRGIDVASLKKAVQYLGGYHESQPYIQDFWDILENELTPEQQRKFLRFMTSCSRQPLLGFSSLEPFPAIQQIRLQDDERSKNAKLPTSSTCMNLLKLPNYKDRTLLKEKLLAAVESGAGFELT